jgi:ribosomal protein S27AE
MNDREKVIVGLTDSIEILSDFDTQEYTLRERQQLHGSVVAAIQDAIALLKAQEPKLVHVTADINRRKIGECPNCGKMINSGDYPNYCGRCGRAVKWE